MNLLFLLVNVLLVIYFIWRKSDAPIAYFILFQEIHLIPFKNIGQPAIGYVYYIILAIIFLKWRTGMVFSMQHFKSVLRSKMGIFFIMLTGTLCVHTILGLNTIESKELVSRYFLQVLPALIYLTFVFNPQLNILAINQLCIGILVYGILLSLILLVTTDALMITQFKRSEISENIGASPIAITRIGVVVTITSIFLWLEEINARQRFLYICGALSGLFMIMLGTSRGPVISIFAALMVYTFSRFSVKEIFILIMRKFWLVLMIFIVVYLLFNTFKTIGVLELFLSRFESLENVEEMTRFLRYIKAFEYYRDSYSLFSTEFLIGEGPAGFDANFGLQYAHNLVLEFIFEYGFVGLVLLYLLITNALRKSVFLFKHATSKIYLIVPILVVFRLMSSMFSGDLIDWRNLFFLSLILVLVRRSWNGAHLRLP